MKKISLGVLAFTLFSFGLFAFQNCAGPNDISTSDQNSKTNVINPSPTPNPFPNPVPVPTPSLPTQQCTVFLASGSSWTVPSDWNSASNTIEAIGNGSDAAGNTRAGGGGGAYSKSVNVALTPGSAVAYNLAHVGVSLSSGNSAGDVYFCKSTSGCGSLTDSAVVVSAQGGHGSTNGSNLDEIGGAGGNAAAGVAVGPGAVKYSGGNGGNCQVAACQYGGAGGGGGAAGPHGNGVSGGAAGGAADAGYGGGGGAAGDSSFPGSGGNPGGAGGAGTEYDGSHGIGGGGGGGNNYTSGGNGGNYGGGAGGSGYAVYNSPQGGGGLIVIKYMGTVCH